MRPLLPPEAAMRRWASRASPCIAETTVKTHLRRLYAKTGTSRQADLVKLVAGFASPLVG